MPLFEFGQIVSVNRHTRLILYDNAPHQLYSNRQRSTGRTRPGGRFYVTGRVRWHSGHRCCDDANTPLA